MTVKVAAAMTAKAVAAAAGTPAGAATMNPAAAAMTAKAAAAAAADTMSRTLTALTSAKQFTSTTKVRWMMALVLTPRMRETSPCLSSAEAAE